MKKLVCMAIVASWLASPSHAETTKSVRVALPEKPSPVVENIGRVFTRQVQQRCDAKVLATGEAPVLVELAIAPGIGAEGFRIEDRPGGGTRIVGNDERGLLYGVGKFLRTSRYDQGGFTPGTWRGTSAAAEAGPRHLFRHPFQQLLPRSARRGNPTVRGRPGALGL